MNKKRKPSEIFWSKVDIRGPNECWPWLGVKNPKGYGRIWFDGWHQNAQRVVYKLVIGPIPDGLCVCHHCDNPGCMNPKHFFVGTNADNVADMMRKGRGAKRNGEVNGRSRLKESQILAIRQEYAQGNTSYSKLGNRYGVRRNTIGRVVRRETWRHI